MSEDDVRRQPIVLPPLPPEDVESGANPNLNLRDISKTYRASVLEEMARLYDAGASGTTMVVTHTEYIDRLVAYLFAAATRLYARRHPLMQQRCAVFALGGYGRGELNLYSDIDLLVLHHWKVTPYVETIYETIYYSLIDAGFDVGHAVRNVPMCVRIANQDLTAKTALLDNRYLCGDEMLRQEFATAMQREIVGKHVERFVQDKAQESRERHQKCGGAIYMLEPDLKEGLGGLRDLHTAGWLAQVKYKVHDLRELIPKGVVSASLLATVEAARDFVWKVRNGLHLLAREENDQLTFEHQDQLALTYGFPDVTSFMRCYYGHATIIHNFAQFMLERCQAKEPPRLYSFFGKLRERVIRDGVRIADDALVVTKAEIFARDPLNIVTVFHDAQRHGVRVGESARQAIRDAVATTDPDVAASPAVRDAFFAILKWKQRIASTLREMHEVGVLEWLLVEFAHLRWRTQRDLYHVFTVDEHTLHGVAEMERLRDGDYKTELPLLTYVMREIDKPEILFLSMLFHDVGKGLGGEHSERGAQMVHAAAARWQLSPDDTREWYLLVLHHLFMSHIAQHRDLFDDAVIANFASIVGSPALLSKLYILTFSDMKSVSPKVWNPWKGSLLDDLYRRTLERFETGDSVEEEREARIARCKERLAQRLATVGTAEQIAAFLAAMPDNYFLATPEESVPGHFQLVHRFRHGQADDGEPYRMALRHVPEQEFSELTIVTQDRPGLFAMLTGALAANALNVVSARISTSRDGVALDVFRLSHMDRREFVMDPDTWTRVYERLGRVLRGERTMEDMLQAVRSSAHWSRPNPRIPTEVTVENDSSPYYTLVDVTAPDRVGFLFSLTHALFQLDLQIHLAKITTNVDQVLDVFYVTDRNGQQVADPAALAVAVRKQIDNGEARA